MKKYLMAAAALMTGAAVAQTAPVAQPAPAVPTAAPAPTAHPVRDKVTTRDEAVQMVRRHFGEMDAARGKRFEDFKAFDGGNTMVMGDPNAAFDRLDTNKDSYISRDEFTKAREQRVERRIEKRAERKSSPKEGKEVRRHMRMNGPGGFGGGMLAMADTNKDGQVTQAEAEALALQHFDKMDANRDGQITPEERRAGRQILIQQRREEKKSGS